MAVRIGQQLGEYRLIRSLGKGSSGEVFLGKHVYLDTWSAIKVLHTPLIDQEDSFLEEARQIAKLSHPNIIRIHNFAIDKQGQQPIPYLVMDYAPHGYILRRHPRGTRLPLATVVSYVEQIAGALQYAHYHHVIHRDVKPENMLLGSQGEILLSDFGIAMTMATSTSQQAATTAGMVAYMAPEQIMGKPYLASDQYALGVIVYEWLSGGQPFQGSFWEVCTQHLHALVPSLREVNPEISREVEQVVMTALAKDPHQRFESVQAFASALKQAGTSQAEAIRTSIPSISPPEQVSQVTVDRSPSEGQDDLVFLMMPSVPLPEQVSQATVDRSPSEGQEEQIALNISSSPSISLRICSSFHSAIGKVLSSFGFYRGALKYYEHAILLEAHRPRLYVSKGEALFNLKLYKEAVAAYDEAIRLAPELSKAYQGRGETYEQLAQQSYDEFRRRAQESYETAKELGPE